MDWPNVKRTCSSRIFVTIPKIAFCLKKSCIDTIATPSTKTSGFSCKNWHITFCNVQGILHICFTLNLACGKEHNFKNVWWLFCNHDHFDASTSFDPTFFHLQQYFGLEHSTIPFNMFIHRGGPMGFVVCHHTLHFYEVLSLLHAWENTWQITFFAQMLKLQPKATINHKKCPHERWQMVTPSIFLIHT